MGIQRIMVLLAAFFLVALSPNLEMALAVFGIGVFVYVALWCHDLFKGKDKS